jgi:hypothetical protein
MMRVQSLDLAVPAKFASSSFVIPVSYRLNEISASVNAWLE